MLKRVIDTDRYDDRLDLRTNLIETFDKAMQFVEKHLPSPFYMEGVQSIDLRNIIFREVIINMLIHKEYLGAEPTRFIIEKDRVYTENSNKPYINGIIDLSNLVPHPKNPNIARFFRIIGQAEELGSGFIKVYKYCKDYCGSDPVITDDNAYFRFILPVPFFSNTPQDSAQDSAQDVSRDEKVLVFCKTPKGADEIQKLLNFKNKTYFKTTVLNPLIEAGKLTRTIPDKPTSKNQKYVTAGEK
jgi:ATP-dependent DNA helicase RecG